jgi:hypothetical protein
MVPPGRHDVPRRERREISLVASIVALLASVWRRQRGPRPLPASAPFDDDVRRRMDDLRRM